jgi:hypothetical protein
MWRTHSCSSTNSKQKEDNMKRRFFRLLTVAAFLTALSFPLPAVSRDQSPSTLPGGCADRCHAQALAAMQQCRKLQVAAREQCRQGAEQQLRRNYSAAKRHKRHKQGMGWNMDLMEPVKLDLNRSRACSRCAFCAFLRLCLSSYVSTMYGPVRSLNGLSARATSRSSTPAHPSTARPPSRCLLRDVARAV